ncbi:hypothetical protein CES85_5274 [Ochrobactrum quorumnocens]|uniref:Uncharacterized protein n=1 Tax=Ochrobactrum quorumnocens TaxID=271865 RepID=A0A248UD63_9HYPH|nr:hypothetical protein CES85_5274 [[Ochrobactrum] quorumnocens]
MLAAWRGAAAGVIFGYARWRAPDDAAQSVERNLTKARREQGGCVANFFTSDELSHETM